MYFVCISYDSAYSDSVCMCPSLFMLNDAVLFQSLNELQVVVMSPPWLFLSGRQTGSQAARQADRQNNTLVVEIWRCIILQMKEKLLLFF